MFVEAGDKRMTPLVGGAPSGPHSNSWTIVIEPWTELSTAATKDCPIDPTPYPFPTALVTLTVPVEPFEIAVDVADAIA